MFGISGFELLIVVVFVLIIFGPDKLPELGRTVGRAMRMFKKAQDDMERVIRMEMFTAERAKATSGSGATTPASPDAEPATTQEAAAEAVSAAASTWAATSEDDEEEEDEE